MKKWQKTMNLKAKTAKTTQELPAKTLTEMKWTAQKM